MNNCMHSRYDCSLVYSMLDGWISYMDNEMSSPNEQILLRHWISLDIRKRLIYKCWIHPMIDLSDMSIYIRRWTELRSYGIFPNDNIEEANLRSIYTSTYNSLINHSKRIIDFHEKKNTNFMVGCVLLLLFTSPK